MKISALIAIFYLGVFNEAAEYLSGQPLEYQAWLFFSVVGASFSIYMNIKDTKVRFNFMDIVFSILFSSMFAMVMLFLKWNTTLPAYLFITLTGIGSMFTPNIVVYMFSKKDNIFNTVGNALKNLIIRVSEEIDISGFFGFIGNIFKTKKNNKE